MKSRLTIIKADAGETPLPSDQMRYEWKGEDGNWHGVTAWIHGLEEPAYMAEFIRNFARAIEQEERSLK